MSRISTFASNSVLINQLFNTNRRLQNEQIQLSTEKVSQTYSGISAESQRLVTYENSFAALGQFMTNNDAVATRLDIASTTVDAIRSTIRDFQSELLRFQSSAVKDRAAAEHLQSAAFRALANMSTYLNTEADGRFIFAGGRVDRPPVDFSYSSLAAFQSAFDGATVTYPTTRAAHIENFSISKDGNDATNWLNFERDNLGTPPRGRITSTTAQFSNVTVGSTITVSGTASNNGTYTVAAVGSNGTYIDVVTEMLTDEVAVPINVTYPDLTNPGVTLPLNATATFNRAGNTISHGGALNAIPVGSAFTVSGSASNNGTYTVASNSAGVITIVPKRLTNEAARSYYANTAGNNLTFTNNVPAATDTIAGPAGTFSGLSAGMQVTVIGTTGGTFNGTYTVNAVAGDGSSITIDENLPAATAVDAAVAISFLSSSSPYFNFTSAAGDITFTNNVAPTKDTITTVAGDFSTLKPGMKVWLTGGAGTNGNNDTYTVDSVSTNGKTITIRENLPDATTPTTDANAIRFLTPQAPGTVAATPYYHGDIINLSHRPSTLREVDWDLTAIDPAFEKALRAMGLIAQGAFGSEGGLDQNTSRVNQASYLVASSLSVTVTGTPPFGTETIGSIEAVEQRIGYKQVLLQDTNRVHTAFRNFLETGMNRIENIDRTAVMANILDDTRTLEASYQALARIRELTLVNFL